MKTLAEYVNEAIKIKDDAYWADQSKKYVENQKKRAKEWKDWLDKTWHVFINYINKQHYDKPYSDLIDAVKLLSKECDDLYVYKGETGSEPIPRLDSNAKRDYTDYIIGNLNYAIEKQLKIKIYPELKELLNNSNDLEFIENEYKKATRHELLHPY